jgi:hypothetical protein
MWASPLPSDWSWGPRASRFWPNAGRKAGQPRCRPGASSLAALVPVLQPRLSSGFGLGTITGRPPALTLGATP